MIIDESDYLMHYGILRKSGRYPWGSGGNQMTRNRSFLGMVDDLHAKGMSQLEIARGFGITTTQLRDAKTIAKNAVKAADIAQATKLKERGLSNVAIGAKMGINESSVRALLHPSQLAKTQILNATAASLKEHVATKGMVDVGVGVERHMGISKDKLGVAVAKLQEEGYGIHYVKVTQLGTGKQTTVKVLAGPGVTYSQVYKNREQIRAITDHSEDGGRSYRHIQTPLSINQKRVAVRYADEGGATADGVIYVRPGVPDITLGGSRYAQVRVVVGGGHYLKGMAMYKDDLPPGVDLVFNTNKHNTGTKTDAMKKLNDDPDNPFGAIIERQITHPKTGKATSAMNIVNEEGKWETWSRTLSSQVLSKQSPALAKSQLTMAAERKEGQLADIMALTNPAVRRKLLEAFADSADSSAVLMKAHALPRQANHVILPINSLKDNEIYAPGFKNGERVVLIRHPHGGIFEIPELTVNNRNAEGKKLLGTAASDAVGINHKVAQHLSGADFDGDTVLVIPNGAGRIKTKKALDGLIGFDPLTAHPGYPGMTKMSPAKKQFEMGVISNLITDMTIRGASDSELARAVRHSMVVIDAEKHNLDWKGSAEANGIKQLKVKYQGGADVGASTLISRAKSRLDVAERKPRSVSKGGPIDKATGKRVFERTGEQWTNQQGKIIVKTQRSVKLAETDDANTLSSNTPIEKIYADHSNKMKALANTARRELVKTKPAVYSASAARAYKPQVDSLNAKLNIALKNAPLERNAQTLANAILAQKRQANPDMEASEVKKAKFLALEEARRRTGAKKHQVEINESEWAAIQAGAVSNNKLNQILTHSDLTKIKELATPKTAVLMSTAKTRRALAMLGSGYTQAEVAEALGVSLTTLKVAISEGG